MHGVNFPLLYCVRIVIYREKDRISRIGLKPHFLNNNQLPLPFNPLPLFLSSDPNLGIVGLNPAPTRTCFRTLSLDGELPRSTLSGDCWLQWFVVHNSNGVILYAWVNSEWTCTYTPTPLPHTHTHKHRVGVDLLPSEVTTGLGKCQTKLRDKHPVRLNKHYKFNHLQRGLCEGATLNAGIIVAEVRQGD